MNEPDWKGALAEAFEHALAYLEGLPRDGSQLLPLSRSCGRLLAGRYRSDRSRPVRSLKIWS